ncbi:MAG: aminopeptidase P family protein [Kiritimatiellales bacterium]|nr:aminopeptidase P family protein [Kiritimatiellota bacterium]MBL7012477.1 aminopeptidase P family protein [Kiritimatiellales bacterium]
MKKTTSRLLISSSKNEADIHYLCGVRPPEGAVLIKSGKKIYLLVSAMESGRMRRTVRQNVTVISPDQLGIKPGKNLSQWIQKLLKEKQLSSVEISGDFPVGVADSLRRAGVKIHIIKQPPCPRREVKSADEIKAIRQSQRAAVEAMKAAIQQIASARISRDEMLVCGKTMLTSEKVRATICHTLLDFDCAAEETIVASGMLSADPHERGTGPLQAGQPIVIDIFPRSGKTGYWGDITRTVCRGPASAALKKQYNAVKAAQAAQLKMLKAGVWTDTVHRTGAQLMESRGFKTKTINGVAQGFIHGSGHGVGLEIHEAPRVSPANHQKLRAGHIITVEPGLYYPSIGGVRIEDTVLITEDGYKMLCSCPKKLEI